MIRNKSELTIITKAKDLCSYIIVVTQKSPKNFRFTFVSRLQNLSLDIIESLYRANDVYCVNGDKVAANKRLEYQKEAMTSIKILCYFALLAREQECILPKQYEQISMKGTECQNLLGAWMNSDRKRLLFDGT